MHSMIPHRGRFSATAIALAAGLFCGTAQAAPAAGPVSYTAMLVLAPGATDATVTVATVPAGFRLVVQTVSYYRANAVTNSTDNLFIGTILGGVTGYLALPVNQSIGDTLPATTLSATFYADPSTAVIAKAYRTGSTAAAETDGITITGTLVATAS